MDSSLILYPRAYNQRGGEHLHSVVGVTHDGREVNVKLRLEDAHKGKAGAPSISEFAREDRKARQACIADPENGPERREGVLLFTRVSEDSSHRGPLPAYIARWAVVLAEDSDAPDPVIGYGRLAIDRDTQERRKLMRELDEVNRSGADPRALELALADGTKFHFPAIVYHPEELTEHDCDDSENIAEAIAEAINRYTHMGVVGGVLLRVRAADGRLSSRLAPEIFSRFIASERRYQTGHEVAQYVVHNTLPELAQAGVQIDVLPLSKIHSGPRGNQYYGAPDRLKHSERLYERSQGEPAICRVAIRLTVFEDTQNTLLSRIYAMSGALGAPSQLDRHGVHLAFADTEHMPPSEALLPIARFSTLAELGRRWHRPANGTAQSAPILKVSDRADAEPAIAAKAPDQAVSEAVIPESLEKQDDREASECLEPVYLESDDMEYEPEQEPQTDRIPDGSSAVTSPQEPNKVTFNEKDEPQSVARETPSAGVAAFLKRRRMKS